eukprot:SAG31_NODE_20512_length_572_cov_1.080338_2_plen_55_part_00
MHDYFFKKNISDPKVAEQKLTARGAWPASKVVDEMWSAVRATPNEAGLLWLVTC